jgi:hypothetical protein
MSTATATATGPRTPEGKAISSQNALKHGLTSRLPVLPSEDPPEYQAFVQTQIGEWQPEGPDFIAAVHEYADICWRLQRVPVLEAKLVAIEVLRMQIDRKTDESLSELMLPLGESDSLVLDTLAYARLIKSGTLTNLHRQERSLNRLRDKVFAKLAGFARLISERDWLIKRHAQKQRELEEMEESKQEVQGKAGCGKANRTKRTPRRSRNQQR